MPNSHVLKIDWKISRREWKKQKEIRANRFSEFRMWRKASKKLARYQRVKTSCNEPDPQWTSSVFLSLFSPPEFYSNPHRIGVVGHTADLTVIGHVVAKATRVSRKCHRRITTSLPSFWPLEINRNGDRFKVYDNCKKIKRPPRVSHKRREQRIRVFLNEQTKCHGNVPKKQPRKTKNNKTKHDRQQDGRSMHFFSSVSLPMAGYLKTFAFERILASLFAFHSSRSRILSHLPSAAVQHLWPAPLIPEPKKDFISISHIVSAQNKIPSETKTKWNADKTT